MIALFVGHSINRKLTYLSGLMNSIVPPTKDNATPIRDVIACNPPILCLDHVDRIGKLSSVIRNIFLRH